MKRILAIGLLLSAGGCATPPCDPSPDSLQGHEQHLLYQNDLLQAKILVTSGNPEGFELAHALLDRIAEQDRQGEVELYRALLLIREKADAARVLELLQRAADKHHPHAIALLYRIYDQPLLVGRRDAAKAAAYRRAYDQLDVARSGYPSFTQALAVIDKLLRQPAQPHLSRAN